MRVAAATIVALGAASTADAIALAPKSFLAKKLLKTQKKVWDPKVDKKEEGDFKVEVKADKCRCPEGKFWSPFGGPKGVGACVEKYDISMECGFFPGHVRGRVCKDGLTCSMMGKDGAQVTHEYEEGGFGKPGSCQPCDSLENPPENCGDAKKNCAKVAVVTGEMCYKVDVSKAGCTGEHMVDGKKVTSEATVEATAKATATAKAEATVEVPSKGKVAVSATVDGNTATVYKEIPGKTKTITVEKEITKEVTKEATASGEATADGSGVEVSGETPDDGVKECVKAEEVIKELGFEGDLTEKQGEEVKKMAKEMAFNKALDNAMDAAAADACADAHEIAMKKAEEEAKHAAEAEAQAEVEAAAEEAAEDAADAAAKAAVEGELSTKEAAAAKELDAKQELSPEEYAAAKAEAMAMAKAATAGAAQTGAAQNAQATESATTTKHVAPRPDAIDETAGGPGKKQSQADYDAGRP